MISLHTSSSSNAMEAMNKITTNIETSNGYLNLAEISGSQTGGVATLIRVAKCFLWVAKTYQDGPITLHVL